MLDVIEQLRNRIDEYEAQLAEYLLAGWQGAILRSKMCKNVAPMQSFMDIVFSQVLKPAA